MNDQKAARHRFFPGKDPCRCCANETKCESICWHRAKWWDVQMAKIRQEMKGDRHGLET